MNCKICLNKDTRLLFISQNIHGRQKLSEEKFQIWQCLNCGITFTAIDIDEGYYDKYYKQDYYCQPAYSKLLLSRLLNPLRSISFKYRVRLIKKYSRKGKKILEVGCGKGDFLYFLPESFEKSGIEINKEAYEYIKKERKDIKIYNTRIDNEFFDSQKYEKYDVIIMWHVLEHVEKPAVFVKNLRSLLNDGGVIIIDVPNRGGIGFKLFKKYWFHLDSPRHLFHYTYNTLKSMLDKYNLKIIKYKGNFVDYFQDLAISAYMGIKNRRFFLKWFILVLAIPAAFIVRFLIVIMIPMLAEDNTYIIKKD